MGPWRVRGFVPELAVRPFNVHVQPRRGSPLAVGAKLDSLGGLQRTEAGVKARPRLVSEVFQVRLHLHGPFDSAERAVAGDDDFRVELNDQVEALEPLFVSPTQPIGVQCRKSASPANTTRSLGTWMIVSPT